MTPQMDLILMQKSPLQARLGLSHLFSLHIFIKLGSISIPNSISKGTCRWKDDNRSFCLKIRFSYMVLRTRIFTEWPVFEQKLQFKPSLRKNDRVRFP